MKLIVEVLETSKNDKVDSFSIPVKLIFLKPSWEQFSQNSSNLKKELSTKELYELNFPSYIEKELSQPLLLSEAIAIYDMTKWTQNQLNDRAYESQGMMISTKNLPKEDHKLMTSLGELSWSIHYPSHQQGKIQEETIVPQSEYQLFDSHHPEIFHEKWVFYIFGILVLLFFFILVSRLIRSFIKKKNQQKKSRKNVMDLLILYNDLFSQASTKIQFDKLLRDANDFEKIIQNYTSLVIVSRKDKKNFLEEIELFQKNIFLFHQILKNHLYGQEISSELVDMVNPYRKNIILQLENFMKRLHI